MKLVALDVGGANIKATDGLGKCLHVPFPLWKQKNDLPQTLARICADFEHQTVVVTMTGELADCFQTKREGVHYIIDSIAKATDSKIWIYLVDGRLVDPATARENHMLAAASNWHALATFAARFGSTNTLLIDIGSTTTDVIPVIDGQVAANGKTDFGRMVNGELVYTGVERSFISGVLQHANHRGQTCPLMNELFATTLDAYTVLEQIPEDPKNTSTADGRPQTRENCIARLARMFGKDLDDFSQADACEFAQQIKTVQTRLVNNAMLQVLHRFSAKEFTFVPSGQGEFIAREAVAAADDSESFTSRIVSLNEQIGSPVSKCATAHALAVIALERLNADPSLALKNPSATEGIAP